MEDVSLIVTIFTLFLLTLVCIYGMYLANRERALKKKQEELHKQVQNVLQNALDQADRMLSDADGKVREMVNHAHNFNVQMERRATEAVTEVGKNYERRLQEDLSASERSYDSGYREIMDEMRNEFKNQLASQLKKAQELTATFTNEQFDKIKSDLHSYEQSQKQAIAERVAKSIELVLADTLQKTISNEEHRTLVHHALEAIERDMDHSGKTSS